MSDLMFYEDDVEELKNYNVITPYSQDSTLNQDFDLNAIFKPRQSTKSCRMASFPNAVLLKRFFMYIFGASKHIPGYPTLSIKVLQQVGSSLFQHYQSTLFSEDIEGTENTSGLAIENETELFIPSNDKFNITASFECIKRLVSEGKGGYLNDEIITLFSDATNYFLGHSSSINTNSKYFILDSLNSNNLILSKEGSFNNVLYPNNNIDLA